MGGHELEPTLDVKDVERPAQLPQASAVEVGNDDHLVDRRAPQEREDAVFCREWQEELHAATFNVVVDLRVLEEGGDSILNSFPLFGDSDYGTLFQHRGMRDPPAAFRLDVGNNTG